MYRVLVTVTRLLRSSREAHHALLYLSLLILRTKRASQMPAIEYLAEGFPDGTITISEGMSLR